MNWFATYFAQLDASPLPHSAAGSNKLGTVISLVLGIMGAVSVLMIVIGGIRYIISRGEPQGINQAKDTIIYAIIGLAITMFATVIVKFVLKGF